MNSNAQKKNCCINQETQGLLGRCTHACSSREGNMKKHEGLTSLLWRGFIHFSSKIGTDSSIAGGSTFSEAVPFISAYQFLFLSLHKMKWLCVRAGKERGGNGPTPPTTCCQGSEAGDLLTPSGILASLKLFLFPRRSLRADV